MALKLFEHNLEAYDAAVRMLNTTGKAAVIHPTGTGKSFIGFKLAEDNPDKHIIWLTPSEYIVKTQLENLKKEGGAEFDNITFITYAKLMLMSVEEIAALNADYCVADEFHRIGAECWGQGFLTLCKLHPDMKMLGLSATHIRYLDNQRDMAEEIFDGNIASYMTLGEAIVRGILAPPKYVISVYGYQEELRKYKNRVERIENTGIRDKNSRELDRLKKALEMADGMDKVFEKNMDNSTGKYIVFCSNRSHMDEMAGHAGEWFGKLDSNMHIYKVYSEDTMASQDFLDFKYDDSEHLRLLFCIDMLNEGVHVNDVDGVILFRPTVSPIIYKQQIGRALSASKKNNPIIFDVVNNFDNLYSISTIQDEINLAVSYYLDHGDADKIEVDSFEIIDETADCRRLFESLERSLSSTWEIYFQAAKEYFDEHDNLDVPKRYVTDSGLTLGMWLNTQRRVYSGKTPGNLTKAQIARLNEIGMRWENAAELNWQNAYNHAKEYFETYGNLDVKASYVCDDGFKLGRWIANMRTAYSNNSVAASSDHVKMLDEIGMLWSKNNALWERNYLEAERYYSEHGNLNVPHNYITEGGVKLGAWIYKLKKLNGGSASDGAALTDEQKDRLTAIGMEWDSKYMIQWKKAYRAACEYYKQHGNLDIPSAYKTKDGIALGVWIRRQRSNQKLTEEQRRQLDRIGMIWSTGDSWEIRYSLAKEYYDKHGNLEVPPQYKAENNVWLGKWVSDQRIQYSHGNLDKDKFDRLSTIGMRWLSANEQKWEQGFTEAKSYYSKHGKIPDDPEYITDSGFQLGGWIKNLQRQYAAGNIDNNRKAELEAIGIKFKRKSDDWLKGYKALCAYRANNGNTLVPTGYVTADGFRLGIWVSNQRAKHSQGALNEERVKCLTDIGFVWDTAKTHWQEQFDCAKHYYETTGSIRVPKTYVTEKGFKLNCWISGQRKAYKQGTLKHEQVEQLREIGIV